MSPLFSLNRQFMEVFNKRRPGLPDLLLVSNAFALATHDASFANLKYVNLMFHAIKDLTSVIGSFWFEYTEINIDTKSITVIERRIYSNRTEKLVFVKNDVENFDQLYSGKSLVELNENRRVFEITKLDTYQGDLPFTISDLINIKNVNKWLDKNIEYFRNNYILPCSFETFIEYIIHDYGKDLLITTTEKEILSNYLTSEKSAITDYLINKFTNAKPRELVPVLFALSDLGLFLPKMPALDEQERLHSALTNLLGNIGTRQGLNIAISKHNSADEVQRRRILDAKRDICHILKISK